MNGNAIVYPISLSYVADWGPWECIRELVTNAMDADVGYKMGLTPATDDTGPELWIESRGNLMQKHLLLGVSEKSGEDAIGQHGEGLKLAMLVLTRLGLTAHIYTKSVEKAGYTDNVHYWNEAARMGDTDVFAIHLNKEKCCDLQPGFTRISIADWSHRLYANRFVREGDPRVVYCDPFGRMVLDEHEPQLYVKGVWVSRALRGIRGTPYRFGYNLVDAKMNRDRRAISEFDVNWEVGAVWASCTNELLLERFWRAVYDNGAENSCRLSSHRLESKEPHKKAIQSVYGPRTVIGTDESVTREAEHIGATVVNPNTLGYGITSTAKELLGTDAQHVQALNGVSKVFIPDKKLGDGELRVLKLLRRLARRGGFSGKILAYILPDSVLGEQNKDDIRMSVSQLKNDETAIATWLHEQSHMDGAADTTDEMVRAVCENAARLIVTYARR